MKKRTIKSAKIINGVNLEVDFEELIVKDSDSITNDISMKVREPIHEDLIDAFGALRIHMVLICELEKFNFNKSDFYFANPESVHHLPDLNGYEARKFIIGGDGDHEGVTIVGLKHLKEGKVMNIVTPFVKFEPEISDYEYATTLAEDVDRCRNEVMDYLEGKRAPKSQLEMKFDNN